MGENPANPGVAPRGSFKHSQNGQTRAGEFDCVQLLARLLADHGHEPRVEGDVVTDQATGLTFRPLLAAFQPIPNMGAQTISTVEVKHPTLIPAPVFEFQHSTGDTPLASIQSGFDQWCKTDLPALADATRPEPRHCTIMKFASEAKGDRPAIKRRLVLAPVAHVQQHPPDASGGQEEHPFCPCCLLTRSWEAFRPQIESPGFYALRLFAMRNDRGQPGADCRVNGEDFPSGKEYLERYVTTWPGAGFELRKQYVVIRDEQ